MTTFIDYDVIFLNAMLFLNRAMDESDRSFDERVLWASMALELLGKSALARVSPLLIADPNESGGNLLIAAGFLEGKAQFVSVSAKTVFARCSRGFKPFNGSEAKKITIPPTSEATFNPAFAPLSVGTVRCSSARSRSPADCANPSIGTRPPADTRFGSSNATDVRPRV